CRSVAPHPLCPLGKTRTKDKYRVVYTDQQRLELEKEFQYNRYITMRRKTELSVTLGLSERQVKIWFQNRRAKERKITRKKLQHSQQASTTTPTPPVLGGPADTHLTTSPSSNILVYKYSQHYGKCGETAYLLPVFKIKVFRAVNYNTNMLH
uniref:Caudal type homeobox 1a n=1 Tax=Dicentrarchus labrax TaxID=13489 RepID=A0A8C4EHQ4_DICLA